MILRAIVIWLGLMVVAIANGVFREAVLRPSMFEFSYLMAMITYEGQGVPG